MGWPKGKKRPLEVITKAAAKQRGQKRSPETCRRISEALMGHGVSEGKRLYIPDMKVVFCNGTREIWEFKPESEWDEPKNVAKWKAAKAWCATLPAPIAFHVKGYNKLRTAQCKFQGVRS